MVVSLIQKGDRGLFIDAGGKLFFPDRSWKDVREGFAKDVKIVKDKGTYAFVTGTMLDVADIQLTSVNFDDGGCVYWSGETLGQKYLIEYNPRLYTDKYRVFVRVNNEDGVSTERVSMPPKNRKILEYLTERASVINVNEILIAQSQVLNFEDDALYANEMFKLLRKVRKDISCIGGRANVTIRVYNSSLVLVRTESSFSSYHHTVVYTYAGELGSGEFKSVNASVDADAMWEKADPLDMAELEDMALSYGVALGCNSTHTSFDERLSCKTFECKGNGVTVYAFNLNGYDLSWLSTEEAKPYIDLVDESFERLDVLKKRLGKLGVGADALSELNAAPWVFPFRVEV